MSKEKLTEIKEKLIELYREERRSWAGLHKVRELMDELVREEGKDEK